MSGTKNPLYTRGKSFPKKVKYQEIKPVKMTVYSDGECHDIVVLRTVGTVYNGRVVIFKCVELVHNIPDSGKVSFINTTINVGIAVYE